MTKTTSASEALTAPRKARGKTAAAAPVSDRDATSGSQIDGDFANRGAEAPMVEPPTDAPADTTPTSAKRGPTISTSPRDAGHFPSKLDRLLDLLRRPEGATLAAMCAATGWQVHSVRGAMAGALKRKGHAIRSDKHDGMRRYRIEVAS